MGEGVALRRTPVSVAVAAVRQLRPKQWTKNAFLLPALLFSGMFTDPEALFRCGVGFASFCLLSSTGYVLNDYLDREADRRHPKKRTRPIASGALPVPAAWLLMIGALGGGVALALWLGPWFLAIALTYLVSTLSYSLWLKHVVIVDVMLLASGFVWRAVAGAVAIGVTISPWLFLCTAFFALFIGFNKRRAELLQVGASAGTRRNLEEYSPQMLDEFQSIVTAATVLCYALYTVLGPTPWMTLSLPWVLYGIFRYIYLIERKGEGGSPDETILRDRPLLVTAVGYALTCLGVISALHNGMLPTMP